MFHFSLDLPERMSERRVVVTGLGALTPLGNDPATTWDNIANGVSGAGKITKFDPQAFRTQIACELKDFKASDHLERGDIKRTDLFTQYALISSDQAIKDSGLEIENMSPYDVGVIWGTGQGGMETFEQQIREYAENDYKPRFSPFFIPKMITNMASGMISMRNGYMGLNYTTVSACATSNTALMDAYNYIKWGKAKAIVSGGSEYPITEASVGGFSAMKAMSTRNDDPEAASRPFDVDRDGFVMGEGSVTLILEEYEHAKARGATIYAEVVGASMTADAYHLTATHPEGLGATKAMQLALDEAGLSIRDIDYLNPHATSTPVGDISEIKAIRNLAGEDTGNLSISATKSMTGHLLGSAGAIEAFISIQAIRNNVIPPTINTDNIDPKIDSDMDIVTGEAKEKIVKAAMSNTLGFGGHNGIVVFKEI